MKKVIIIGKGRGWRDAPVKGETWGVNDLCVRRDVKLVFNMHPEGDNDALSESIKYANKKKVPLVTLEKIKKVPTLVRFPIEKIHTHYFTNSIAYMIAYAIYKKVSEIEIYGCGVESDSDYSKQRHNIDYWIGYARGLKIKVTVKGATALLKVENGLMYGYSKKQEKY
jgi:hypothetical protein